MQSYPLPIKPVLPGFPLDDDIRLVSSRPVFMELPGGLHVWDMALDRPVFERGGMNVAALNDMEYTNE